MNPGVDKSSWSTDTKLPGDITCHILLPLFGNLVLHGCLVMVAQTNIAHLGIFTVSRRLGSINSDGRGHILFNKHFPRR